MKLQEIVDKFEAVVAEMVALAITNITVYTINATLHIVTGTVSLFYIIWRWRRDYKKDKDEHNHKGS